ncbi:MAG: hypothetical protein IPP55_15485 [Anaerolineales bacterium]|nr:hypothetical protein [Anaerolineales bacterium]
MYRNRVRPLLALLLLVLASLACIPGTERVIGEVTCVDDGYLFGSGTQYICYCPTDGKAYRGGELSSPTLRGIDPARLKTLACSDPFAQTLNQNSALPTEPPTEEPTEEPRLHRSPNRPGSIEALPHRRLHGMR